MERFINKPNLLFLMDQNIAERIREYVSEHCSNQFPPDRRRQIELLTLAGYSRLRTSSGAGSRNWKDASAPLEECSKPRVYQVARSTYLSALKTLERRLEVGGGLAVSDWPAEPEKYGEGCPCVGYIEE